MEIDDLTAVNRILHDYFKALYTADVERLKTIIDINAQLWTPGLRLTREQWLDAVATRAVPRDVGNSFGFEVLALDIVNDQAMAKLRCPLFNFHYIDFIGLIKENGKWRIVTKMYTDIGAEASH